MEHDGGGYSWTPPESEPDREVINPNSGSSGSKPSINGMDLDLDTYTDLNGDYNVENKYGLNTGEDIKITIEQILNNTNIEAGYSYTKEITTGVIYDLTGLSRIRNVIGIKVNLNPTSEIQLSDKEISIKFEKSTIDISEDGITIDVDRQLKMGILKGFTTFEKKFLEEFENDNFRIGSVRQAILPLNETESPFYIPIYKQELPVSDAEGYVTLTYKHIYEWHQTTAAAAVVLGYKGVMAGGKAGFGLLGEWWKSRGPLWDTPVLE